MDRRDALKTFGLVGVGVLVGDAAKAAPEEADTELFGMLYDSTLCAGCRNCEYVCAETNGLPAPIEDDEEAFARPRKTSETQWTVINRHETADGDEIFVKNQCMHCVQPACGSACLTKAMLKTEEGPVIWRGNRCMGCRFCMISCPFDIPKFEYHSANPRLHKCRMCWDRLQSGEIPACAAECPAEAILFGTRRELLDVAKARIYQNPGDYVSHIYGEHEAGGTGWLYLSPVPFEELGFDDDIGTEAYPQMTREFLYAVPLVLTLFPGFMLGVNRAVNGSRSEKGDAHE